MSSVRYAIILTPLLAYAQDATTGWDLRVFGGHQGARNSTVTGSDPGGVGSVRFTADWEGRSSSAPVYYGIRLTHWGLNSWGWSLDMTHAKVYASAATLQANRLQHFEFSDGLNLVTSQVTHRWPNAFQRWTPHALVGAGVAIPHVELTTTGGRTSEYQLTGPAAVAAVGTSHPLSGQWSIFSEYLVSWSDHRARLTNGGHLDTTILTWAVHGGVICAFP